MQIMTNGWNLHIHLKSSEEVNVKVSCMYQQLMLWALLSKCQFRVSSSPHRPAQRTIIGLVRKHTYSTPCCIIHVTLRVSNTGSKIESWQTTLTADCFALKLAIHGPVFFVQTAGWMKQTTKFPYLNNSGEWENPHGRVVFWQQDNPHRWNKLISVAGDWLHAPIEKPVLEKSIIGSTSHEQLYMDSNVSSFF